MLRRAYYVVASIYIFCACLGLLVIDSDWLAGGRQQSSGEDHYTGLWPLPPEQSAKLVTQAEPKPAKPAPRAVQSNTAAVHAGETLIKWPPAAKALRTNLAAVHAGETLIKWPPAAKAVRSNLAAVHAGEMLIKWPPAAKTVQTNLAAVHAGETLIKWPPAAKAVRSNLAAVHAGETLIKRPTTAAILERKSAPPSTVSSAGTSVSTGAIARQPEARIAKIAPKEAGQSNRIKRKSAGKTVMGKQRRPQTARAATESGGPDLRRSQRMANTAAPTMKVQSRRMRASDGNEVRRAIGQLNEDDRRAFRSRCGQILSAPGKFARSHVEICTAASL
jgi:hypothetical protein